MTTISLPDPSRKPVSGREVLVVTALLAAVLATRLHSYLLFHALVELFALTVVLTTFSLAWNTQRHLEDGFIRVLGLAMGPFAFIAILHTLAYKGMGVFPEGGANLPTQLWIALRILQAGAMIIATIPAVTHQPAGRIVLVSAVASAAFAASIFMGVFPDCFVEGQGLTPFKVAVEYAVMAVFTWAGIRLWRDPEPRQPTMRWLGLAILATGALESAAFTLYTDVYGALNMAGHLLGLVNSLLLYAAVAWMGLAVPQEVFYTRLHALKNHFAQEAERANSDIVRFSEVLAHHLQEPVRQQYLFGQMLARSLPDQIPDEARRALDAIMEGAMRQRALLHDAQVYLGLSGSKPPMVRCDSEEALDQALAGLKRELAATGAIMRRGPLPPVRMDQGRLAELFRVLLDNAVEYRRPEAAPEISVAAKESGTEVEFSVTDNGIGIPEEYYDRVFRVFERLSPLPGDAGTGIGLAVAKKIVETAGGRIWLEPARGHGLSVRFTLPAADAEGASLPVGETAAG